MSQIAFDAQSNDVPLPLLLFLQYLQRHLNDPPPFPFLPRESRCAAAKSRFVFLLLSAMRLSSATNPGIEQRWRHPSHPCSLFLHLLASDSSTFLLSGYGPQERHEMDPKSLVGKLTGRGRSCSLGLKLPWFIAFSVCFSLRIYHHQQQQQRPQLCYHDHHVYYE